MLLLVGIPVPRLHFFCLFGRRAAQYVQDENHPMDSVVDLDPVSAPFCWIWIRYNLSGSGTGKDPRRNSYSPTLFFVTIFTNNICFVLFCFVLFEKYLSVAK